LKSSVLKPDIEQYRGGNNRDAVIL
jgi:hypothetical protein